MASQDGDVHVLASSTVHKQNHCGHLHLLQGGSAAAAPPSFSQCGCAGSAAPIQAQGVLPTDSSQQPTPSTQHRPMIMEGAAATAADSSDVDCATFGISTMQLEEPVLPILELPDPCLLAVLQHCADDPGSLCSAARAHSRLHQAAVMVCGSVTLPPYENHLDSLRVYLSKYGQNVSSITMSDPMSVQAQLQATRRRKNGFEEILHRYMNFATVANIPFSPAQWANMVPDNVWDMERLRVELYSTSPAGCSVLGPMGTANATAPGRTPHWSLVRLQELPSTPHLTNPTCEARSNHGQDRISLRLLPGGGFQGVLGAGQLPLKRLRLKGCNLIDGPAVWAAIAANLPDLETLSLKDIQCGRSIDSNDIITPAEAHIMLFDAAARMQQLTQYEVSASHGMSLWEGPGIIPAAALQHEQTMSQLVDLRLKLPPPPIAASAPAINQSINVTPVAPACSQACTASRVLSWQG